MGKHSRRRSDLNSKPVDPTRSPAQAAREFDDQYEYNKQEGDKKEASGAPRPEPGQASRTRPGWARGEW